MTTTMNNTVKGIEVDHINGAIVVTKNFLKLAKNPSTSEFERLIYTRKECPTYGIVVRTIDKNRKQRILRRTFNRKDVSLYSCI